MKWLRCLFAMTLAWLCFVHGLARWDAAAAGMPVLFAVSSLTALTIIYFRRLRQVPPLLLLAISLTIYVLATYSLSRSGSVAAALSLRDLAIASIVLAATTLLAWVTSRSIHRFEDVAADVVIGHFANHTSRFADVQGQMYRELRRSRQHGRPLALLAVDVDKHSLDRRRHQQLLEEMQRELVSKYTTAQVAELLRETTSDCDVVAYRDGYFLVLLPETQSSGADAWRSRFLAAAEDRLGMQVRVGLATFPDQEVTLVGLLERATAELKKPNGSAAQADRVVTASPAPQRDRTPA